MIPDSTLVAISAVGECTALFFAIRAKLWRVMPVFCAYILWALLSDIVWLTLQSSIIPVHLSLAANFQVYITENVVDSLLQFIVLVELAWSVLRPVRSSLPKGTPLILAGLVAIAGILVWPVVVQTIPSLPDKRDMLIFHIQETFAILRIGCFLVMAGFSQVLSIGWRDRELQVATGLGFYSIVNLIVMFYHTHQGASDNTYHLFDQAVSISYLGTLSYWVLSFSAKEQERKEFSPQMQQLLLQLGGGARAGRIALGDLPSTRTRKKD